ncbi:Hypothetical predicted protein [Marmota monax]|uniref:Uncharacterized protein n=1 Tax=Marmota monax TaxID=9995 RepID=A0A5E4BUV7_MARMO|nr:Hypothetical predicted protein [Marmota monax]
MAGSEQNRDPGQSLGQELGPVHLFPRWRLGPISRLKRKPLRRPPQPHIPGPSPSPPSPTISANGPRPSLSCIISGKHIGATFLEDNLPVYSESFKHQTFSCSECLKCVLKT